MIIWLNWLLGKGGKKKVKPERCTLIDMATEIFGTFLLTVLDTLVSS